MALISINKYDGSKVEKEAMLCMSYIGINAYCKSFGYNISITPIMGNTPKGLIDDSPNSHKVTVLKSVSNKSTTNDKDLKIIGSRDNIKATKIFGIEMEDKEYFNTAVDDNIRWYNHEISFIIDRKLNENNSDYSMRIVEILWKIVNQNR